MLVVDLDTGGHSEVDLLSVSPDVPNRVLASITCCDDDNISLVVPLAQHHTVIVDPLDRLTLLQMNSSESLRKFAAT